MKFPKKKWAAKRWGKKALVPESVLQSWTDKFLEEQRIRCFRIPDWAWVMIRDNDVPHAFGVWFRKTFKGLCDNPCIYAIGRGYSLMLHMELKTEDEDGNPVGQLKGKQKVYSKNYNWHVCRNKDVVTQTVFEFEQDAEALARLLLKYRPQEIEDIVRRAGL